ncbi:DNA topoisomerase 3 [Pasteurella multocida]
MRLFIAEKPDVAKAIAEALGGGRRTETYFSCGDDKVTWCYGHLLELYEPQEYDEKYAQWNLDDLPIVPIPYKKKPVADKVQQLNAIIDLVRKSDVIVNAGDVDAEGQYLVDEILDLCGDLSGKKIQRILINDNNIDIVKKALSNLRDNKDFHFLRESAEARAVSDFFYGINLSRLYTIKAQEAGAKDVYTVGRVQTPILGLVVRRDREFLSHQKQFYYKVIGEFNFNGCIFSATYINSDTDTVDEKNRLINYQDVSKIVEQSCYMDAYIKSIDKTTKEESPPLPFNLLKLQQEASKKFNYSPDKVKAITQQLREKYKLITYNRSDCQYLSDEHHADAPRILRAIKSNFPSFTNAVDKSDPNIKSRAFNSSKISAHHGIIPTGRIVDLSELTNEEQKIYLLIARAYIAQFWPKRKYSETRLVIGVGEYDYGVKSIVTTDLGWRVLYSNDSVGEDHQDDEISEINFDSLSNGSTGECLSADWKKLETKPRPLYTMDTLLSDLTRIANYVLDPKLKKVLIDKDKGKEGEHGGIGTPATRDEILKGLFDREFLTLKGKTVISTDKGRAFYDVLPESAKYPDMTALWHQQLQEVEEGILNKSEVINGVIDFIKAEVDSVKVKGLSLSHIKVYKCPKCGAGLSQIKGMHGLFWACNAYKTTGCNTKFPDKNNSPDFTYIKSNVSPYKCKLCGRGLIRRKSSKNPRLFFWSCSNYPVCKQTYPDVMGKPNLNIVKN